MPTITNRRKGPEDKNRKGRLMAKASSFHGRSSETMAVATLHRPRTSPELFAGRNVAGVMTAAEFRPQRKLTKLLLNVSIQRSIGAVMVVMSPESTVGDLIVAALRQYRKEGRRPVLGCGDCDGFALHYSQFSLQSLDRDEKLTELESRNFFLCPRKSEGGESGGATPQRPSCSKHADKGTKPGWLKFMDFFL